MKSTSISGELRAIREAQAVSEFGAEMLRRVETRNYYIIMRVDRDAELAQIKQSYTELVRLFHPDRTDPLELGLSPAEQTQILRAITESFAVLSSSQKRAAYDESRGLSLSAPATSTPILAQRRAGQERPAGQERVAHQERRAGHERVAHQERRAGHERVAHQERPPLGERNSASESLHRARRAQQLRARDPHREHWSSRPPAPDTSASLTTSPQPARDAQTSSLRSSLPPQDAVSTPAEPRRRSDRPTGRFTARPLADQNDAVEQAKRYLQMMEDAVSEQRYGSAANLAKMALQFDPENPRLAHRVRQLQALADREMADQLLEQARDAEAHRDHARATRLFERAANGLNQAELYHRAGLNALKENPDLRRVVDLARNAARLDPQDVSYKIFLAEAYLALENKRSALTIIEQGLKLDRRNAKLKELRALAKS